jgi:hypothetical protein
LPSLDDGALSLGNGPAKTKRLSSRLPFVLLPLVQRANRISFRIGGRGRLRGRVLQYGGRLSLWVCLTMLIS